MFSKFLAEKYKWQLYGSGIHDALWSKIRHKSQLKGKNKYLIAFSTIFSYKTETGFLNVLILSK